MTVMLETRNLHKNFGGLRAISDVNFTVEEGELHCVIGPNGAGKSTLFKLILGTYPPTQGQILLRDAEITNLKPFERVRRGISIKMQVPGIFTEISTRQNLEIALQSHYDPAELGREVERLLEFIDLIEQADELAGNLSHGQQQWLEIGMATGIKPSLLLLDEPTAGMSPEETYKTGDIVRRLNEDGVTILVVEHDMNFIRQIARNVTVLHFGKIFASGTIDEIINHEGVTEIYLGQPHDG